ncbi:MAG: MFS transporter [Lentisphaerae bacterium]|nr:MFS transporter [Lentisphaerota bacterium]
MPPGIVNAYWFQGCNATSWSLALGTPMLLYLKNLGASATIIGLAVAMVPLFGILQIPAADYADRIGHKLFVVRGWTSRSAFILGMAIVVLLPEIVNTPVRLTLILLLLACFSAVRGISLCGYLPWITHIIPESARGTFIARDTACMYVAVTATMLISSAWFRLFPAPRQFGALLLLSYAAAMLSVVFLRRIPDSSEPLTGPRPRTRPPWGAMLCHPPFRRYLVFTVAFNVCVAALGVVWLTFMRDRYQASASLILGLTALTNIIAAGVSRMSGRLADHVGSRPLLGLGSVLIIAAQTLWMAVAAGALPRHMLLPCGIMVLGSSGFAMLNLANTRLLMGLVPVLGRSHFFAIASVATSLTLGIMPIAWGYALDALLHAVPQGIRVCTHWTWNAHSLVYGLVVTGLLATQFLQHRLDEPRAMSTDDFLRLLLIESPARMLNRALTPFRRLLPPL